LLIALSGTAIALPGKNTVNSGDLKKGAVRSSDLHKNAVNGKKVKTNSLTGSDIKKLTGDDLTNDSLGGNDINEGTLGAVPSANNANNANRANSAAAVDALAVTKLVKAEIGETQTVLSRGPLTIQIICNDADTDTNPEPILRFKTSQDNSAAGFLVEDGDPDLDAAENADFPLGEINAPAYISGLPYSLATPDGTVVAGNLALAVKGAAGATCGVAAFATS
jgi:hypothetical protein